MISINSCCFPSRYETCCNDLPDGQLDQVRKRREWLEKRIALSVTGDRNQCRLSIPTVTPLPANSFFDHVLDNLTQVMSQVCDKNPGTSDVDLCELSHDVSNSLTSVPDIIQSLMFQDLDQYLTRLVLDFDPQQCLKERQRVKSVLLQLEVRLDHVEERMSRFILSIEKRKGCWIREISRLLTEIVNNNCRLKLLATSHERQTNLLPDYREADRLVDSVVIDSSLTGDDDLDTHLRSLEQMIRSTD